MSDTVSRRVTGVDVYNWTTPAEGRPGERQFHTARRGDVIEVTAEEAKRGEELGALGAEDDEAGTITTASSAAPADEVALTAGLALPDGSPGPNAPDRAAMQAQAAQRVRDGVAAGDYGDNIDPAALGLTDGGEGGGDVSDDDLRSMSAAEVVAHLNQNPGDVDRVDAIEGERGDKARVTVTKAIESHRTAAE